MTDREAVATLEGVTFAYGRLLAVENVSFSIAFGERVCLVGRNGSGKTTLIKGMLGLLRPRSGTIKLAVGHDGIAFLPQNAPEGVDFPATVREIVLSGCQNTGRRLPFYSKADRETAERALESMDIADLAGRRVGELSGGQRQRAFLARCLCRRPKLLLLDEPYAALDPVAAEGLDDVLARLQRDRGIAVLMTSHDLGAVAAGAERVLVLDRKLVFDGSVGDWLDRFKGRVYGAIRA